MHGYCGEKWALTELARLLTAAEWECPSCGNLNARRRAMLWSGRTVLRTFLSAFKV